VNKPHKDLAAIISSLEAQYPGDIDTVKGKLISILSYCITRKLLDAATLATLRADAHKWPESIQKLLVEEVAR
jgi:hypothetical protein